MSVSPMQDVIVKLLTNIGSRKEVEQYLRHYAGEDGQKHAVVRVSGQVIESSLDALASSLTFLHHVGLNPMVVHGGGPQLDRALDEAGIDAPRVDGLRVLTPRVLDVARRVFHEVNLKLVDALEALGTRARPFTSGVFEAQSVDHPRLGLAGRVTHVREGALASTIRAGHLPIIAPMGETPEGQIVVLHGDTVTSALALAVNPHKLIYLNEAGGVLDEHGHVLSAVNIVEDLPALLGQPWLAPEVRERLQEIASTLERLPPTSSVSITSPEHLAKELFTHRGAGTLVRRGELVRCLYSFDDIDKPRLRGLLEKCFGRLLDEQYFEKKKLYRVYLADSYRATAILTREGDLPYLDKFAVTTEAQGEGIGGSIWHRMRLETPKVFWRARAANAINAWYAEKADGLYKTDKWVVFWCGMQGFSEVQQCIERALALPATLRDHGSDE
jgi:acetylglutamate kinase